MKRETKTCPRCKAGFTCKSGEVLLCQCQTLVLSAEQLAFINSRYEDGLCVSCLAELRSDFNQRHYKSRLHKFYR